MKNIYLLYLPQKYHPNTENNEDAFNDPYIVCTKYGMAESIFYNFVDDKYRYKAENFIVKMPLVE